MTPPPDAVARLRALPEGAFTARIGPRRWNARKTVLARGRSLKIVAEELGGPGYVSANLYLLAEGPRLYPCEMPAERVLAFLRDAVVADQ